MKTKFGAIIVDGRGKTNGHVASKNRAGNYLRTKVTPVNPRTSSQLGIRNTLGELSKGWAALSQASRNAWNAAVSSFAKTDIFGDLRNPSGFNLYVKLNANLATIGNAPMGLPPTPELVPNIALSSATAVGSTAVINVAYTPASNAVTVVLKATAPQSPGKSFVKSEFRIIGTFDGSVTSPFVATSAYAAKFGSITGMTGKKIFFETVAISENTGMQTLPQQVSCIIS